MTEFTLDRFILTTLNTLYKFTTSNGGLSTIAYTFNPNQPNEITLSYSFNTLIGNTAIIIEAVSDKDGITKSIKSSIPIDENAITMQDDNKSIVSIISLHKKIMAEFSTAITTTRGEFN